MYNIQFSEWYWCLHISRNQPAQLFDIRLSDNSSKYFQLNRRFPTFIATQICSWPRCNIKTLVYLVLFLIVSRPLWAPLTLPREVWIPPHPVTIFQTLEDLKCPRVEIPSTVKPHWEYQSYFQILGGTYNDYLNKV